MLKSPIYYKAKKNEMKPIVDNWEKVNIVLYQTEDQEKDVLVEASLIDLNGVVSCLYRCKMAGV